MGLVNYTKNYAIAESINPALNPTKDFNVVYQLDKTKQVKSKKISARSGADAMNKFRVHMANRKSDSKFKQGNAINIRAFETPDQDAQYQAYGTRLTEMSQKGANQVQLNNVNNNG